MELATSLALLTDNRRPKLAHHGITADSRCRSGYTGNLYFRFSKNLSLAVLEATPPRPAWI